MWLIEHVAAESTPKIRTEFDAYKTRRRAMFVPKRQNLSQAPRDRFNIASAARPKREISEAQREAALAAHGWDTNAQKEE